MSTATKEPVKTENEVFGEASEVTQGYVGLNDIFVDLDMNSRDPKAGYDAEKMQELEDSIIANGGIYLPLLICAAKPGTDTGGLPWQLVGGYRRVLALKRIAAKMLEQGKDASIYINQVPVVVLKNVSIGDFNRVQLIENLIRADLSPIEIGHSIERAIQESKAEDGSPMTAALLSKQLGFSEGKISQYRKVCQLPEEVQAMVAKGEIPFASARFMASGNVPSKFYKRAADYAKALTTVEFEAKCRSLWGRASVEAAQPSSGDASGGQKTRTFMSAKELEKTYLPELKKRVTEAKTPAEKALFEDALDAIDWLSKKDGTKLGAALKDFDEKRNAEKVAADALKEQEHAKTRLLTQVVGLMRQHITKSLEEGETKPTAAQALALVKKSLEKDYDAKTGTVKVAGAKKKTEDGQPETQTYTQLKVGTLDDLIKVIHDEYQKRETERRAAIQKRKDEKAAEKKESDAKAKAAAEGTTAATATEVAGSETVSAAPAATEVPATGTTGAAPQDSK